MSIELPTRSIGTLSHHTRYPWKPNKATIQSTFRTLSNQLLPLSQAPRPAHVRPTRLSLVRLDMHNDQLETGLPVNSRESWNRAFHACAVPVWNALPPAVLNQTPDWKRLQSFKVSVFRHLRAQQWHWATDTLYYVCTSAYTLLHIAIRLVPCLSFSLDLNVHPLRII